jgi:hypothetical protein
MHTSGHKRFIVQIALLLFYTASAGPMDLKDSRVRVPWNDFKQIIDRLSQPDTAEKGDTVFAPRDYAIRSLSVSGTIKDEKAVQLEGELALQVFASETLKKNGWVKIPLNTSGYANNCVVSGASMNGRNVPLLNDGGTISLLMAHSGSFTIKLSYSCPIVDNEGTRRLALSLPNTAAGFLNLSIPGKRVEVTVNEIKQSPIVTRDGTKVGCAFNAGGNLIITLTPLADGGSLENAEMQMSPKVFAATGMLVTIKENQVRYRYRVDYQIWHKKVTTFAVAMSDTVQIEQVEGAGIQEWKVERTGKKPMLVVRTNFAPEKEYSLFVDFSQKLDSASGTIRVPELTATDVSRESGYLAVMAAQTIEVTSNDSSAGLTPADPLEMPSWLQQERDLIMKYKYSKHPYRLALDIRRHTDMPVLVAIADEAHFQTQITAEGYALAKFCYTIRNNYKQYLSVTMPAGWKLWSSLIDGAAVMPATGKDSCQLMIPLKKTAGNGEGSGFVLELVYWKEFGAMHWAGSFAFEMPLIDINCQQIHGELWTPKKYSYSRFKGTLKKVASYSSRFLDSYNRERYDGGWDRSRLASSRQNFYVSQQAHMKTSKQAMSLPVEIDIPATGVRFFFGKSLTIAGEKAGLSLGFMKALPAMGSIAAGIAWIVALLTGFIFCRLAIGGKSAKKTVLTVLAGVFAGLIEIIGNELGGLSAPGLFGALIAGAIIALLNYFALLPKKIPAASAVLILAALLFGGVGSVKASEDEPESDLSSTSIAIPWSDFKPILDKLQKRQAHDSAPVTPPCDYTIALARFEAEKKSDRECVVSAFLSITVLNDKGWTEVPLGEGCALYPDIRLNGAPAPLGKDDGGNNVLVIKGAGEYELVYRFAVSLVESAGRYSLAFPLPRQAAASISITLDDGGYAVSANGRRLLVRPAGKGRYTYFGGLGSGEQARIDWQREVVQQGSTAAMLLGQASTFYSIGMGMIGVRSDITLTILHQDIRRFSVALPNTTDIIDLTGPAVATWESADSADQRLVTVFLKYNVRDRTTFTLTAEQAYDDTASALVLPSLTLPGATRQEGYIGVGVISNIELTPSNHSSNVVRKDKRELPANFEGQDDALYVYQYLSGSYAIGFTLNRHRNVAAISALVSGQSIASVMREDGKTITQVEMTVKNRGEQFLRLRWRRGWQLWSLFCNGNAARPAFDSTAGELLVPLEKSTEATAETRVKIVYLSVSGKYHTLGLQKIEYPSANMPVQNVNGSLYIPQSISPFHYGGNLKVDDVVKKRYFTIFWPDLFGPVACAPVATDFYQKAPAAPEQAPLLSRGSNTSMAQTISPQELEKSKEDRIATHRRAMRQGVLGIITESKSEEIDATLRDAKGLKAGGGTGRRGSASIGYAGSDDEVFGTGGFAGNVDALLGDLQQEPQLSVQALGTTESGLLSIPVTISFDGIAKQFNVLMLKSGDLPKLTFMYRKVPDRTPFFINLLIFICMLIAASFLTRGLWAGWSKRLIGYGIALPAVLAFGLARLVDIPLSCNLLWIVPLLFFSWKAIIGIKAAIAGRRKVERETETALKEALKRQELKDIAPHSETGPIAEEPKS